MLQVRDKMENELFELTGAVRASLYPRLVWILRDKAEEEKAKLTTMFDAHVGVLADFMQQAFEERPGGLGVEFFCRLHRLYFPAGYVIRAVGNDGVAVEMLPGEWRKQVLHRHIMTFSQVGEIEQDFRQLLLDFNARRERAREDVLHFYFLFGNIHPFGDANGTISALVCDVLCQRYSFRPLRLLNVRFKDKAFLFHLISLFENDRSLASLTKILVELDGFDRQTKGT